MMIGMSVLRRSVFHDSARTKSTILVGSAFSPKVPLSSAQLIRRSSQMSVGASFSIRLPKSVVARCCSLRRFEKYTQSSLHLQASVVFLRDFFRLRGASRCCAWVYACLKSRGGRIRTDDLTIMSRMLWAS